MYLGSTSRMVSAINSIGSRLLVEEEIDRVEI